MISRTRESINEYLQQKVPWIIFFMFLAFAVVIQSQPHTLVSLYDSYYHTGHALTYATGEIMQLPVLSTINTPGGDIYPLYHALMAPFTSIAQKIGLTAIDGAKILHSLLIAGFFTSFFLLCRRLLQQHTNITKATQLSIIGTLLLWSVSVIFIFRIFLIRPEIIILFLVLYTIIGSIYKHNKRLLLIGATATFTYSASFILLIVPACFAIAQIIYKKSIKNITVHIQPFMYVLIGTIVGIIARPDTVYYLLNAYGTTINSLYLRLFTASQPGELYALPLSSHDIAWIVPFIGLNVYYIYRITTKGPIQQKTSFQLLFIWVTTNIFFLLTLIVQRAAMYSIPFIILFEILFYAETIQGKLSKTKEASEEEIGKSFWGALIHDAQHEPYAENIKSIAILALIIYAGSTSAYATNIHKKDPRTSLMVEVSEVIQNNSDKGDLVFNTPWSTYPLLQYTNNANTYAFGMDPTFTRQFDPELYNTWQTLTTEALASSSIDVYDMYTKTFDAPIIFIDASQPRGAILLGNISLDARFEKLYSSEGLSQLYVYKVNNATSTQVTPLNPSL